jgi:hypothetical protein
LGGPSQRLAIDSRVAGVIRVQGALDPGWSERLGGLRVTLSGSDADDRSATTEHRGELLDQAALLGMLTTLNDQRLPLLEVTCAPAQSAAAEDPERSVRSTPV